MKPSYTNPVEQIDRDRVITIQFPDATFTLEKLELEGTTLLAFYSFKDTTGPAKRPYENSYKLSVFNINGPVRKVQFKRMRKGNGRPLS